MSASTAKHLILGTAGHVDHGKSALIRALTGVETDRLKEEKARGISIELGFAELPLADDLVLGVVDVPGHEKFIKQMVAGAGGVDLAFLVVAADEGVMPQTIEHLEILQSLGVAAGVVVITKTDLVDSVLAEVVAEEVRDLVAGTFLEDRPVILVSARTGDGLDALRETIEAEARMLPDRDLGGPFRLPVDRVFSMPGAGVIVTGTCWSGRVKTGDQLLLEPENEKVRVREVQVHGRPAPEGGSGQRLALALHGVKKQDLQRGSQVLSPGCCTPCHRLDARITLVPHYAGLLKNRMRVHVHHAGREVLGRVVLLDQQEMSNESKRRTGFVQIHLESRLVARPGDRLVLRFYSPVITLAGGVVLACQPPRRKRFDQTALDELAILEQGDASEIFRQALREAGSAGLAASEHAALASDEAVFAAGKRLYHRDVAGEIIGKTAALMMDYIARHPLRAGMPKEEMRRRIKFRGGSPEWTAFCEAAPPSAGWRVLGDRITPAEEIVLPRSATDAVRRGEAVLRDQGLAWPGEAAIAEQLPGGGEYPIEEFLRYLVSNGRAVQIAPDYLVHPESRDAMLDDLRARFRTGPEMAFGDFRELTGLSRKLGIPMLEYLDRNGYTRREGDVRRAGPRLETDDD